MLTEIYQISEVQHHRLIYNFPLVKKEGLPVPLNKSAIGIFKKIKQLIGRHLLLTVLFTIVHISSGYSFADIVSLTVSSGNYSDETIVRLHEQATFDFDGDWDAYKLSNGGNTPNFYTAINNTKYAINSIPALFEKSAILLNFKAAFSGHYTIFVKNLNESYDSIWIITLEDKLLNIRIVLQENTLYEFNASTNDLENRFTLHYENISAATQEVNPVMDLFLGSKSLEKVEFEIDGNQAYIRFINTPIEYATIEIVNTTGKVIYRNENVSTKAVTSISLQENSSRTMCIARIIFGNELVYKKLYF